MYEGGRRCSVRTEEFIEKFKGEKIKGAEIKLGDSLDYYIVQKHGKKTDLYIDKEVEHPEDPPVRTEDVMVQPEPIGGTTEFGTSRGLLTVTRYPHKKEAELVKHMKDIEDIKKYIDFEKVSEVIYEKS